MLVFVEFTRRKAGVTLAEFHAAALRERSEWAAKFPGDRLLLNVARTWWLGPQPDYLTVWYSPHHGLERIDEWQEIAEGRAMAALEQEFLGATELVMTGCYEPLLEPVAGEGPLYYVEYFAPAEKVTRDAVVALFRERQKRHS